MDIAIPIFDRFTALDAVGPYEVLSRLPGARVRFVAHLAGPVRTDNRMLTLLAEARFEDVPSPEVLVVPGGIGTRALLHDERLLGWIRSVHETSEWTTSVCSGSLLLAAAGLLEGIDAATHWGAFAELGALGVRPCARRVVEEGKLMTAAGVSSGIDMGLMLAARIAGDDVAKAIQLAIEYDPEPPFDSGSPAKAEEHVIAMVRERTAPPRAA
jgi:putative intracellular protease/amidase